MPARKKASPAKRTLKAKGKKPDKAALMAKLTKRNDPNRWKVVPVSKPVPKKRKT